MKRRLAGYALSVVGFCAVIVMVTNSGAIAVRLPAANTEAFWVVVILCCCAMVGLGSWLARARPG
jgi:hypothetical protein